MMIAMKVVFEGRTELAPYVWEYRFRPEKKLEYRPGQYADFAFPFSINDPHGVEHRSMTLVSHPNDRELRFITRLSEPIGPYKIALQALAKDDEMLVGKVGGNVVLPKDTVCPLVFVAQGIGIALIISILSECKISDRKHNITLFWKRRKDEHTLLKNSQPGLARIVRRQDVLPAETLTAKAILETVPFGTIMYLSGSPSFVDAMGASLVSEGFPPQCLAYDSYTGCTVL
jgi:ferredoxin-NADP reductase